MANSEFFKLRLMAIGVVVLWGSAFVGIRVGLQGYHPGSLALLRYAIASICMLFFYLRLPKRTKPTFSQVCSLCLSGVIGFGFYNIALNYGEITVRAGVASFILGLMPMIATVLSVFCLRERLPLRLICGVIIALLGMLLILQGEKHAGTLDYGILLVLIASISGAVYIILQKPLLKTFHPIEVTSIAIWSGTILLLIFTPHLIEDLPNATRSSTLAAIYMGVFPAAIGYALWCMVLQSLPVPIASSYLYAMPFATTLMGLLFLAESPSVTALLGGLIALFGAYLCRMNLLNKPIEKKTEECTDFCTKLKYTQSE